MPKINLSKMMFKKRQTPSKAELRDLNAKEVKVSVIFTRLNEVDTMNEKFSCEATIFASWIDYADDLQKSVDDEDAYFWDHENHWDPQLYIDNAIGDIKEKDVKYNFERYYDKERQEYFVEVNMIKRIQGSFFEKLELYHFPFDVQDLSLTITSHRPASEIYINQDLNNPSKITKHASLDKHIWKLHEHVNIKIHTITNDFHLNHGLLDNAIYNHAAITIQCRVSRKPGYFVCNCLLPTLMITLCVFFTFLMDYERLQYRFSLLFTTMLTSITFRWSIHGRVLPTVSYLTFLDMYCISSILVVFTCMVWHGIYSQIHVNSPPLAVICDQYAMWAFVVLVLIMHITQTIWFFIAFRKRHELDLLDKNAALDYLNARVSLHKNLTSNSLNSKNNSKVFAANANGEVYNYENTIKPQKIYYSYSKLQNSNMTTFRLKQKELSQLNENSIDEVFNESGVDKQVLQKVCKPLATIEFTLSGSDKFTTIFKNDSQNSCDYHYIPLIQQISKDSKDESV
jgi:hypothetical protein